MRRLLLLGLLAAAALRGAEDGGQPEAWTKRVLGARIAALGQAASALPDDAGAALLNPALAAAQTEAEIGSQMAFLAGGERLHYLGAARPFFQDGRFAWSLGYAIFDGGSDFERRRGNTGDPDSTFSESASQIEAGLASWVWDRRVSVGFDLRILSHALGDAFGGGVSSDFGLYWKARPWLELGASARDAFNSLEWSTETKESLPLRLRLGGRALAWDGRAALSAELESSTQQALRPRAGLELWPWARILALRGGFDGVNWSAGLGLRAPWQGLSWGLDYSLGGDPVGGDALQQRVSLELGVPL